MPITLLPFHAGRGLHGISIEGHPVLGEEQVDPRGQQAADASSPGWGRGDRATGNAASLQPSSRTQPWLHPRPRARAWALDRLLQLPRQLLKHETGRKVSRTCSVSGARARGGQSQATLDPKASVPGFSQKRQHGAPGAADPAACPQFQARRAVTSSRPAQRHHLQLLRDFLSFSHQEHSNKTWKLTGHELL